MNEADKKTYDRIRAKLHIDPMRLDEALIEAGSILQDAGECCAYAVQARDIAKNELAITESREAATLRAEGDENGKPFSEVAIKSKLPNRKAMKDAVRQVEDTKLDADLWQVLVNSVKERNNAVEHICKMQIAGFMAPSAIYEQQREKLNEGRVARKRA